MVKQKDLVQLGLQSYELESNSDSEMSDSPTEEPEPPSKSKNQNPIWDYFELVASKAVPGSKRKSKDVKCKICEKILHCCGGTTSPLIYHISQRHVDQYLEYNQKKSALLSTATDANVNEPQPGTSKGNERVSTAKKGTRESARLLSKRAREREPPVSTDSEAQESDSQAANSDSGTDSDSSETEPENPNVAEDEEAHEGEPMEEMDVPPDSPVIAVEEETSPDAPPPPTPKVAITTKDAAVNVPEISNSDDPEVAEAIQKGAKLTVTVPKQWDLTSKRQVQADLAYTIMTVKAGTSFELVGDVPVQRMFEVINPCWNLQKPSYYSSVMVDFVNQNLKKHLLQDIEKHTEKAEFLAMSMSVVATTGENKYLGVYLHKITEDFDYIISLISCLRIGQSTQTETVTNDFDLQLMEWYPVLQEKGTEIYLTYDTEVTQLLPLVRDSVHKVVGLPCQSQKMKSVVMKGIHSVPEASEVMELASRLNTALVQNEAVADMFISLCHEMQVAYRVVDYQSREPKMNEFLTNLVLMLPAYRKVASDSAIYDPFQKVTPYLPNKCQENLIRHLSLVLCMTNMYLEKFDSTSVTIHSGESNVMNWNFALNRFVKDFEAKSAVPGVTQEESWGLHYAKQVVLAITRYSEEAFSNVLSEKHQNASLMAAFFNPKYRGRTAMTPQEMQRFIQNLVDQHPTSVEVIAGIEPYQSVLSRFTEEEMSAWEACEMAMWRLEEEKGLKKHSELILAAKKKAPLQLEIDLYMSLVDNMRVENILKWWLEHRHEYPLLSEMARNYLAIPFSLVPMKSVSKRRHYWQRNPPSFLCKASLETVVFLQQSELDLTALSKNWPLDALMQKKPREKKITARDVIVVQREASSSDELLMEGEPVTESPSKAQRPRSSQRIRKRRGHSTDNE